MSCSRSRSAAEVSPVRIATSIAGACSGGTGGLGGTGLAYLVMGWANGSYWTASLLFGGGLFVLDLTGMIFFINYLSLRQAVTPDRLLGRVTATMRLLASWLSMPCTAAVSCGARGGGAHCGGFTTEAAATVRTWRLV